MSLFSFDEQSGQLSLVSHPKESGFPVTSAQLVELLEQSAYADFELIHANIGSLFNPSHDQSKTSLVIANAVNAQMTVRVSDNNMLAEARITTAFGGKLVNVDQAQTILKQAGVVRGVNRQALDKFLGQQLELEAGTTYSAIVAHGQRPKDGCDARFVRLCMTAQDRILSPQERDGGKVDMRDLGAIITVKPGTPLMKRVPATPGEEGFTVFGDTVAPKPGRDFEIQVFDGTRIDPSDPNLLIADAKGVPVAQPRGMRVDDVLCYENIDVTTGHVEFDGSVIVSGDIKDGMKVKASGDITVIGFVESASLECDGAITVVLGAIGRKRGEGEPFSCSINAKRTVSIGYAQYCKIHSEQDLFIDKQALHCDLSSRRLIRVGKGETPRGKIIGGNILDAMRIETGEIGAPSGTRTRISIAQDWHSLREKQQQFKEFEKLLAAKAVALQQAKQKAHESPKSTKRDMYLQKLAAGEKQLSLHMARNRRNTQLVQQKIKRLLAMSRVKVNELMHPGVELKIARDCMLFSRIYPPHMLKLDEGKITQQFAT
ncbi:DUF342 domain-containing protein [Pseudoalteromonas fenneropenaei]|uniref:DUF342 domain-containing protein n=1 Tax=Pseudoalteromonas fenneropenaei TaxID=1737459 RepID=A0ABV7CMZ2_9GAMM